MDIILWSDGTWCYREDYFKRPYDWFHMSDDYIVLAEGTAPWADFSIANNLL